MAGFEQRYANIFTVKGLAKVLFCLKKAYFCHEGAMKKNAGAYASGQPECKYVYFKQRDHVKEQRN